MKKIKFIIGLVTFAVLMVIFNFACNEDTLDLQPLGDTEASYFTNQDAFERATYGVYAKFTDFYWYNASNPIHSFWLLPGDDMTTSGDYPFETFAALQPGDSRVAYYWRTCYQVINRANTLLYKINELGDKYYTDTNLKNTHIAEATFIRSLMFYDLFVWFGTAPLIKERIQGLGENTRPKGSTGTELLDQAITDLQAIADNLPDSWPAKFLGRATKDAAYGLLGKCLVTRACYSSSTKTADYQAAITAFNKITSHQLAAQFGDNFDGTKENNIESLFEFQASNATGFENIWLDNDFQQNFGSQHAFYGFFNGEWSIWGQPCFIPTQKLMNAFDADDPRVVETFQARTGNQWNGWEFVKYTKRNVPGGMTSSLNNTRILRMADVLLLKAEALLKSGGSKSAAIDLINQVRARARNSVPSGPPSTNPADLNTAETNETTIMGWIMDERFRELAGEEGIRFIDLRRWHSANYINMSGWGAAEFSSVRTDLAFDVTKHLLYPIPTNETDLNPNVTQNTGY